MRAGDTRPGRFAFGYEEALGYAVTDVVRDKDGIGAALALLGLAAVARSAGASLIDAYDQLEVTYGVHATAQVTVPTTRPAGVMAGLRADPPPKLAGQAVIAIADLTGGTSELPSADVLTYRLAGGRVVIRPSGTEPKIKAYLEVVEPVAGDGLAAARARAEELMEPLATPSATCSPVSVPRSGRPRHRPGRPRDRLHQFRDDDTVTSDESGRPRLARIRASIADRLTGDPARPLLSIGEGRDAVVVSLKRVRSR